MKKLFVILTMMLVASSALFARGTSDGASDGGSSTGAASSRTGIERWAPIENKVYDLEVTFYKIEPVAEDAPFIQLYNEMFNVNIIPWNLDQSKYAELLNLRIVSGDIPDIIELTGQASLAPDLHQQGVLLPIDLEVYNTYAPDMMARLDELRPNWKTYSRVPDGTLTFIPEFPERPNSQSVIWRGDWLRNVGIDQVPETLEEFEAALYAFANDDPDGNGVDDTYGASLMVLQPVFGAFGAMPFWSFGYEKNFGNVWHIRDDEIVYAGIQPEMKDALALLAKWYEDGVLDPEFVTGENQGGYWANSHAFLNGRIGYTSHGAIYHWTEPLFGGDDIDRWGAGSSWREMYKIDQDAARSLAYGLPPIGPNGHRGTSGEAYLNKDKGEAIGFHVADEPDKLGKILEIKNYEYESYENFLLMNYGVQGEMWEWNERVGVDGTTYQTPDWIGAYEEQTARNFAGVMGGQFPPLWPVYMENQADIAWRISRGAGQYVHTNDMIVSLPSETMLGAELEKITTEAYYQIITGERDIDYFDAYVETWLNSGGRIFQEEARTWFATTR